jgi:hypothetical protein
MPWKACLSVQFTRAALCCGLIIGLLLFSPVRASARPVYGPERQQSTARDRNSSPTITLVEAEDLLNLLPVVKELRAKGMELKWNVQDVPTMNNKDYYFFWIYNVTAQKASDIGSISVGDYAVNKHTADVRVWQVSQDVSYGDDGVLVTSDELEHLQEILRGNHGIDSTQVGQYRSAHLAVRLIPRALGQSAVRLPVTERLSNTAEVSCWKDSDHLISRLGRSPIITSSAGYRAYAEVQATAFRPDYQETYPGPLCENTVKLYLAKSRESSFQVLLDTSQPKNDCIAIEGKDSCEVNGIQLLDWSKDGRFLLADLVLWVYESDALVMRVPIIYDMAKSEFARPDVYHFFDEYYKTDAFKQKSDPDTTHCEFELRSEGFAPDGNIVLSASRPPDDPSYDQVFCLDKNQSFLFDLGTNNLKRLPSSYKAQHYGTWSSEGALKP